MEHSIRLDGKTALVTGASSGLGWRFAQILAQAGARVALAARSTEKLEQLKREIESAGGSACVVRMDVTEVASVRAAVLAAESALGGIDILVNNSVVGAAAHGEIVTGDHHRPSLDPAASHDQIGRNHVDEFAGIVVARLAGNGADFVKRARVEDAGNALAHRQLAQVAVALDLLRPAHPAPEFLTLAQFVYFRLPGHDFLLRWRWFMLQVYQ